MTVCRLRGLRWLDLGICAENKRLFSFEPLPQARMKIDVVAKGDLVMLPGGVELGCRLDVRKLSGDRVVR